MKKPSIIVLLVWITFHGNAQKSDQVYTDDTIRCIYETTAGRWHGLYISYYNNGQKKAEGKFENNYRTGTWSVWDTSGALVAKREYSGPFTFRDLLSSADSFVTRYSVQRNALGYVDWFFINEKSVTWAKRVWRFVTPGENPLLFDNNRLFRILNQQALSGKLAVYEGTDEDFRKEAAPPTDTGTVTLLGFKLREICTFDDERRVSEKRITGICPVVINRQSGDTLDYYWVYFSPVRKYLAQEYVESKDVPAYITTLDDVFFFRYFSGPVYKVDTVEPGIFSPFRGTGDAKKEAQRWDIQIVESEHDLWMQGQK